MASHGRTDAAVALALGSGGARGYAHIGVIQVVEERGFEVATIAGSSMGALVGGLHAAGQLEDYAAWVRGLRQLDVVRLLDPSLSAPGVIRAEKVVGTGARDPRRRLHRGPPDPVHRSGHGSPGPPRGVVPARPRGGGRPSVHRHSGVDHAGDAQRSPAGRWRGDEPGSDRSRPPPSRPTRPLRCPCPVGPGVPTGVDPVQESAEARPMEEWTERFRASASQLLDRDVVRSRAAALRFRVRRRPGGRRRGSSEPRRSVRPAARWPRQVRHDEPLHRGHAERAHPVPPGGVPARRAGGGPATTRAAASTSTGPAR